MLHRCAPRAALTLLVAILAACGDATPPEADAGGAEDVGEALDLGVDAGPDVVDAGPDAADAGPDAADAGPDVVDAMDGDDDAADAADAADVADVDDCDGGVRSDGGACLRCAAGERVCGERCAAGDDPTAGCGAASCEPCAYPNGVAACAAGACAPGRCLDGFAECDLDPRTGCEVSVRTDRENCGACGHRCALDHAAAGCAAGVCVVGACDTGFGDCDGTTTNGCETSVLDTMAHCGACDRPCAPAHGTGSCAGGACGLVACAAGFDDCDGLAATGCEVDLGADGMNCGACGRRCAPAHGAGACRAGACAVSACDEGFADCDGDPANGCEADLRSDAMHCGACPQRCEYPNATGACREGACAFGACLAGFTSCDGDPANGCEVETARSPDNCGACGRVCDRANATPACVAGQCRIGRCDGNAGDCDGSDANGCEVNLDLSVANCGACGRACAPAHATPACEEGRCAVASCSPGFANCNGSPDDGCEVDTRSDLAHCGECGSPCRFPRATPVCAAGQCHIAACEAGFGDCNGDEGDGCETSLTADPNNCGVCGVFCPEVCRGRVCEACSPASAGATCRGGAICRCVGSSCACAD